MYRPKALLLALSAAAALGAGFRPYHSEYEKQATWAAWTVRKNLERYERLPPKEKAQYLDFVDFLGDRYAPANADNDPNRLNANWETNVRAWYQKFQATNPAEALPVDELREIASVAQRVKADAKLLAAIRKSENGALGLEFGIIHTERYRKDKGIVE